MVLIECVKSLLFFAAPCFYLTGRPFWRPSNFAALNPVMGLTRLLPISYGRIKGGQPPCRKLENELWGVPIMDADRIEVLLSRIREGSEKQFFEFLGNPDVFDLLRDSYFC